MKKVMVFHPGQQHSYRLATALNKVGLLGCYCTTVYNRPASLTRKMLSFLKGDSKIRAEARHCNGIRNDQVVQFGEFFGLLTILFDKLKWNRVGKSWNQFVNDYCGKKAAKYAIKNGYDCVISYNNNSKSIFEYLSKYAPKIIRVMDASAANVLYMKNIYERDMELAPDFKSLLLQERGILWNKRYQNRINVENTLAQYILAGSEFVKKTYVELGFPQERVFICPYGVNLEEFKPINMTEYDGIRPLECIYVGGTKELKGISYLLEAFMDIPKEKAVLTVVGAITLSPEMFEKYSKKISFTGTILHSQVADMLREKDVMVFPSLGDGFGLAVIEAMSSGIPVIASENTGSAELIRNKQNGFVIPIQDKDAIINSLYWIIDHPKDYVQMARNARVSVKNLSWIEYDKKIEAVFGGIINRECYQY